MGVDLDQDLGLRSYKHLKATSFGQWGIEKRKKALVSHLLEAKFVKKLYKSTNHIWSVILKLFTELGNDFLVIVAVDELDCALGPCGFEVGLF